MKLKEWKSKLGKLKKIYDSVEELKEDCKKKVGDDFYIMDSVKDKLVIVLPEPRPIDDIESFHMTRDSIIYRYTDDFGTIEKVNAKAMIEKIVEVTAVHIAPEELMKDVLNSVNPEELIEIYQRVIEKKGKIREEEGCYKLLIGGKRGAPFELMIRS